MREKIFPALCKKLPAALLLLLWNGQPALGYAKQSQPTHPAGKITRVIETCNGRRSYWGLKIELETARFRKTIRPTSIKIVEGKHDHDETNDLDSFG